MVSANPISSKIKTSVRNLTKEATSRGSKEASKTISGFGSGRGGWKSRVTGSSTTTTIQGGISPAERAAQQLAVQRSNVLNQQTALQSKANLVSSQLSAYNKIQNALNRGTVIKPEWREQAGLSSAFVNQAILSKRRTELQGQLSSLQKEEASINTQAGLYNTTKSYITSELEKPAGTSKISTTPSPSRYANILSQTPTQQTKTTQTDFQQNLRDVTPSQAPKPSTGNIVGDFVQSAGETVFGLQDEGRTTGGAGGIYRRTQETFFGTAQGGADIGRGIGQSVAGDVGGGIGKVVGGFVGGGLGTALASYDAGVGTIGQTFAKTTERQTQSKLAGDVVGFGVELGVGLYAAPKFAQAGVQGVKSGIKTAPSLLKGLGFGKQAATTKSLIKAGKSGLRQGTILKDSIYISKAETVASAVGKGIKTAGKLSKNPLLTGSVFTLGAVAVPEVAQGIGGFSVSKSNLKQLDEPSIKQATNLAYSDIGKFQESQSFVGGIGGQLGLGASEKYVSIGGVPKKTVETAFRQRFEEAGLTKAKAGELAKEQTKLYKSRQTGVVGGLLSVSTGTELLGGRFITPIVEKSIIKAGVQTGLLGSLKVGGTTAIKTAPYFFGLGVSEGLVSTGIADIGQKKAEKVSDLPRRIVEAPQNYIIGGLVGGLSATGLGTPIVGLGVARTVQPTASALGRRGTGKLLETTGNILDPFEAPGDYLATFFGKKEPSFAIGTKIRSGVLVPNIQLTSQVKDAGRKKAIGVSAKTPVATPSFLSELNIGSQLKQTQPVTQPNLIIGSDILSTNIGTPTSLVGDVFNVDNTLIEETNIAENINVPVPVPINIGVPISTPISRAGLPFLFPPGGFGGAGGGRIKGRKRVKYINEFAIAFSAFKSTSKVKGLSLIPPKLKTKRRK